VKTVDNSVSVNDRSMTCNDILERQFMREKLSDTLTERIFQITEIMLVHVERIIESNMYMLFSYSSNKPDYVPKPPHLSELDLVFDTSYTDIQPYLFKVITCLCLITIECIVRVRLDSFQ
jgi:hypothetical protein